MSVLTIFACPKPFVGHIADIQYNALKSWSLLTPSANVIIMGNEPGCAEISKEMGFRHFADLEYTALGTPLVSDIFMKAEKLADSQIMAYVNSDMILFNEFSRVADFISRQFPKFLITGQRMDYTQIGKLDFSDPDWQKKLLESAKKRYCPHSQEGMDYFIFKKGLYDEMPPFALGRCAWDGWLFNTASEVGAVMINATPYIHAIHQNHGYNRAQGGRPGIWEGKEAAKNREMASGIKKTACDQGTLKIDEGGNLQPASPESIIFWTMSYRLFKYGWCLRQASQFWKAGLYEEALGMMEEGDNLFNTRFRHKLSQNASKLLAGELIPFLKIWSLMKSYHFYKLAKNRYLKR